MKWFWMFLALTNLAGWWWSIRMLRESNELNKRLMERLSSCSFQTEVDNSVPPTELHFRDRGRFLGKIVNLAQEPMEQREAKEE